MLYTDRPNHNASYSDLDEKWTVEN